jgi:luciferase family oxidoreductase group 1
VAAETTGIRVGTGGILLPLYQPLKVAETARVLHALHPARIDLGIGRSLGGLPLTATAFGQQHPPSEAEFQEKLTELLAFLHGSFLDGHPYRDIDVMPQSPGTPPVWLLGSSVRSAVMAALNGLPYSYAQFINPAATQEAIGAYRAKYVPSEVSEQPQVILGIGVYCADTEDEAQRVFASQRLFRRYASEHTLVPIASPESALEALRTGPDPLADDHPDWPRYVVGTPDRVRERLVQLCSLLDVDELVVPATIHSHRARLRSYELLAKAFDLSPRR